MTRPDNIRLILVGIENHDSVTDDGFNGDVVGGTIQTQALQQVAALEELKQRNRRPAPVTAIINPRADVPEASHAANVAWWLRRYAASIEKHGLPPV